MDPSAESWSDAALRRLRDERCPLTSQREAVVRWLEGNELHPSAAEVCGALPAASRSTVYKTLALLVSLGLARAVPSPSGELRFDPRTDEHDHFHCVRCGGLTDVPSADVRVAVPEGFTVRGRRLVVEGTCPACAG